MERPMDIENLKVKATIKYRGVKIHAVNGVITEIPELQAETGNKKIN